MVKIRRKCGNSNFYQINNSKTQIFTFQTELYQLNLFVEINQINGVCGYIVGKKCLFFRFVDFTNLDIKFNI